LEYIDALMAATVFKQIVPGAPAPNQAMGEICGLRNRPETPIVRALDDGRCEVDRR
jgi:hypothetical protein